MLSWIKAPNKVLPYFVARVSAFIRDCTKVDHWRHVDTKSNPADLITRGANPKQLATSKLWLAGPEYLVSGDWPKVKVRPSLPVPLPAEEELQRLVGIFSVRSCDPLPPVEEAQATCLAFKARVADHEVTASLQPLTRISTLGRGLRVLQHVGKFLARSLRNTPRQASHLENPLLLWLLLDQWYHFREALTVLRAGGEPTEEKWRGFEISLHHGLIHVGGRTRRSPVPLLHKHSHLARLWLLRLHGVQLRHAGGPLTLKSESRKHFWVFQGSSLFKQITRRCVQCIRSSPRPKDQQMAPLPAFRLDDNQVVAFEHVAIDFGGPWTVQVYKDKKVGTIYAKRYLLLICCAVYRAVRCIVSCGRSVGDVALALQEFASRNRVPGHIHSDNAPEFVRLSKEFAAMRSQNQLQLPLSPDWSQVQWTFGHPRAPHTNGLVESLIGVSKRAISHALHGAPLTEATLRAAMAFAEDVVNRRPIGNLSEFPSDPEPLTPGMFTGQQYPVPPLPISTRLSQDQYLAQWRQVEHLQRRFSERFFTELIPELNKRAKWWDVLPPPHVGQVVVALNCQPTMQGQWPLGRIVEVLNGRDGVARGAIVVVAGKEFRRHMCHLVPLI